MQWNQALELLREMRQDRVALDTATFNSSISACGKGVEWKQALELLREMMQDRVASDTITFNSTPRRRSRRCTACWRRRSGTWRPDKPSWISAPSLLRATAASVTAYTSLRGHLCSADPWKIGSRPSPTWPSSRRASDLVETKLPRAPALPLRLGQANVHVIVRGPAVRALELADR